MKYTVIKDFSRISENLKIYKVGDKVELNKEEFERFAALELVKPIEKVKSEKK